MSGWRNFWLQPERDPSGFHGAVNDREQLGSEGVQVEVVAQACGVRRHGLGCVVSPPVAFCRSVIRRECGSMELDSRHA